MTPYETLGVANTATPAQIKKAYRRLAQDLHPDKEGGDAERFKAVQQAYDLLMDPERRATYDRDGTTTDVNTIRQKAESMVTSMLVQRILLDRGLSLQDFDPVQEVEFELSGQTSQVKRHAQEAREKCEQIEKAIKRLSRKSGQNVVVTMLQGKLKLTDEFLVSNLEHQQVLEEAKKVVKDYDWEKDQSPKYGAATEFYQTTWDDAIRRLNR